MGSFSQFFFKAGEGEQISTTVSSASDSRSAIVGRVLDRNGQPVENALVLLFETVESPDDLKLTAQGFTDGAGHFAFGPLIVGSLYLIKVFRDALKVRELELLAEPPEE
ncbi:carboxypeptidase-like regulatory domain-containing protein [Papillibacter cinnamivorans]|uniref:Carboxypeptidase regulatory-like domain-containing protein n=1 Tax=Papillibacter cinnamivorans DSM 12816 TaxID=1122930 RepID=A0A1W2BR55_9FIRM|nr:carboxypeptidase-like regulatory domain-containing protein [Papillibacter cinnamivorans]SMC75351.1 hypothetical protein SAMN02745168_2316 [Papillibacter cinnamivorans DSM 12816]